MKVWSLSQWWDEIIKGKEKKANIFCDVIFNSAVIIAVRNDKSKDQGNEYSW